MNDVETWGIFHTLCDGTQGPLRLNRQSAVFESLSADPIASAAAAATCFLLNFSTESRAPFFRRRCLKSQTCIDSQAEGAGTESDCRIAATIAAKRKLNISKSGT